MQFSLTKVHSEDIVKDQFFFFAFLFAEIHFNVRFILWLIPLLILTFPEGSGSEDESSALGTLAASGELCFCFFSMSLYLKNQVTCLYSFKLFLWFLRC